MTLCSHIEAGRRCIRQAPHEPHGHITVPWSSPAPVCSQCRCDGDPDTHDDDGRGYLGKCRDCSCPAFQTEGDI